MTGLLVERNTPLVQLQDTGRFGCRNIGVTQGGALGWISMSWANALLGAQIAGFSGQSLFDFFNHPWQVDARADRMGMRILGPELRYLGKGLISEGIPLGAIQVPPDGQPIILLNDRLRFVATLQETAQKEHLVLLDQLERLSREGAYCGAD